MIIARGSLIFQQKCLNANVRTVPKFPSIGGGGDCSLKTRGVFCFVLLLPAVLWSQPILCAQYPEGHPGL